MTPEQASLRARKAAYSLHARYDGREITAGARAAFLRTFEQQVDPTLSLPAAERVRRTLSARKAYMTGLALASSRVRGARRVGAMGSVATNSCTQPINATSTPKRTTEASDPGRSNEGAADHGGRPLRTA
jgi:hypothetical protein